jgi:predicted ATPase
MITAFHASYFKALRDISVQLTPIHVLIGPNDSGKSSILQALATLSRSADFDLASSFEGRWEGRELVWYLHKDRTVMLGAEISVSVSQQLRYELVCEFDRAGRGARVAKETIFSPAEVSFPHRVQDSRTVVNAFEHTAGLAQDAAQLCGLVRDALSGVQYFRWNPRMLALPVASGVSEPFRLNSDGFGLAMLLDDILGSDRDRFDELESEFIGIFPSIKSIKLIRQPAFSARPYDTEQVSRLDQAEGKGLAFQLRDSKQWIPASQVSDGMMLILGYLAVLYSPNPPRLLLAEEPENGIHPKLLQNVIKILRGVLGKQAHTQVVLTTHSPYAVDLFEPTEVTLCTKRGDGSIELTPMSKSPAVRNQISLFSLGEIWTAEGDEKLAKPSSE